MLPLRRAAGTIAPGNNLLHPAACVNGSPRARLTLWELLRRLIQSNPGRQNQSLVLHALWFPHNRECASLVAVLPRPLALSWIAIRARLRWAAIGAPRR